MNERIKFIYEKETTEEDDKILVIYRVMHPKGFGYCEIQLYFSKGNKFPEDAWIWSLNVEKKHRGERIGSTLLKYMENIARKNKFGYVNLYVSKDNKELVNNFYHYLGYHKSNSNENTLYHLKKKL